MYRMNPEQRKIRSTLRIPYDVTCSEWLRDCIISERMIELSGQDRLKNNLGEGLI